MSNLLLEAISSLDLRGLKVQEKFSLFAIDNVHHVAEINLLHISDLACVLQIV